MKTVTVHTRVSPEIKEKADAIFTKLGLTTSQAITLFLTATVNYNGLPFELKLFKQDDKEEKDEVYLNVLKWANTQDYVSMSKIQREFSVGFNHAGKIIKKLIDNKIVESEVTNNKGFKIIK